MILDENIVIYDVLYAVIYAVIMLSLRLFYAVIYAVIMLSFQVTGIHEVDIALHGDRFSTLAKMTLYKLKKVQVVTWEPTKQVEELLEMLDEVAVVTPRSQNIVLIYECNLSVSNIYHVIENFFKDFKVVLQAGSVELGVVVYINKGDHKQFPASMDIMGITPKRYKFKLRGHGTLPKTITTIQAVMKNIMTNIYIARVPQGSFSFDQMIDITRKLPMDKLLLLKGRALMKPSSQQSEFEKHFLKVFVDLKVIRELKYTSSSLMFSAYEPPDSLGVVPLDKLINLNQKGKRRREVQGTEEEHSTDNISSNIC